MKLVQFSYIDPKYVTKAEKALEKLLTPHRHFFALPHKGYDEIITIAKKDLAQVKQHYITIGTQFSGNNDQINKVLQEQTHQMEVLSERVDGKDMVINNLTTNNDDLRKALQDKEDMISTLKSEVARLKA